MADAKKLQILWADRIQRVPSENAKLGDKRGVALFTWPSYKFWAPFISPQRPRLQTWNLVGR